MFGLSWGKSVRPKCSGSAAIRCRDLGTRTGPRERHLTVGGTVWHQAEGAFLLLGVVQPKYRIEAVEQSPELDNVLWLGGLDVEPGQEPSQP